MIQINDLHLKKRIPEISSLNLRIDGGECYVLLSAGDSPVTHLINIFSGLEKEFTGSVKIDGIDIRVDGDSCSEHLVHVTAVNEWPPDMKIGDMVSYFKKQIAVPAEEFEELYIRLNMERIGQKRISELEEIEWRKILFSLAQLKKSTNYIFRDFVKGMTLDFILEFKKSIQEMKEASHSILYLSDDVFFAPEIGDRIGFMKKGKLLLELKAAKLRKMNLKELYFQFLAER